MGLDVSLFKSPNAKLAIKQERDYECELDGIYSRMNQLEKEGKLTKEREEEFDKAREDLRISYGIDGYRHESVEQIHLDSKTEPNHLFKIGYLRSSYNEGGINTILSTFGMGTLYDIFAIDDDDYYQFVDWKASRERCLEVITKFEEHMASPMGKYGVATFRPFPEKGVATSDEALERFNKELLRYQEQVAAYEEKLKLDEKQKLWAPFGSWSSGIGQFYLDQPLKVAGIIPQIPTKMPKWALSGPAVFLIFEDDPANNKWYLTALKITLEMIDYVLADPHPEHFFMGWSG